MTALGVGRGAVGERKDAHQGRKGGQPADQGNERTYKERTEKVRCGYTKGKGGDSPAKFETMHHIKAAPPLTKGKSTLWGGVGAARERGKLLQSIGTLFTPLVGIFENEHSFERARANSEGKGGGPWRGKWIKGVVMIGARG